MTTLALTAAGVGAPGPRPGPRPPGPHRTGPHRAHPMPSCPGCGGWSGARGSLTLELAVLFPVFLLLVTATAQVCLYFYARAVALAAARTGVRTARLAPADLARGTSAAASYAARTGGAFLTALTVSTAGSNPTVVTVTVTGRALTLIPGLTPPVRQQAAGAVEQLTTPASTP